MHKKNSPHLDLVKIQWKKHLTRNDVVIDATCGNGHDTLFLATFSLVALFAIDIQQDAISNTQKLLEKNGVLDRVCLYCRSHEDFDWLPLPKPPKLIVYNLGYLPGKNKQLTTLTNTTLSSLTSAVSILEKGGALSITCYPGHLEGKAEEKAILFWAESLCSKHWSVSYHRWINRINSPTVLWIYSRQ